MAFQYGGMRGGTCFLRPVTVPGQVVEKGEEIRVDGRGRLSVTASSYKGFAMKTVARRSTLAGGPFALYCRMPFLHSWSWEWPVLASPCGEATSPVPPPSKTSAKSFTSKVC
jgi:hypothetical protein